MNGLTVNVVVPVYNARRYLEQLVPVLKEIDELEGFQVLIIDSSSTDGTAALLRSGSITNIYTVKTLDFDHGGTRSLAKHLCDGDIIVYFTQDALLLSVEGVKRLVSVFIDDSIGAAYGRQLSYADTNLFGKHLRLFNYSAQSYVRSLEDKNQFGIKTAFLSNSFSAYRRTALDRVGWFKDGLILGEDVYAGTKLLQAGYKLAYVADAQVYHSHNYTIVEEFSRYFDIGVFHQMESWILVELGKPEGEGKRYIKSEFKYLLKHNAYHLIPEFFARNGMKYLGYNIGKHYSKLPKSLIKKISMHRRWWGKNFNPN